MDDCPDPTEQLCQRALNEAVEVLARHGVHGAVYVAKLEACRNGLVLTGLSAMRVDSLTAPECRAVADQALRQMTGMAKRVAPDGAAVRPAAGVDLADMPEGSTIH